MLCQKCKKNEANVFYREDINGKSKSYALCSECAHELEEKGEINTSFGSVNSFYEMPTFGLPSFDPADFFGSVFGALSPAETRTSGHKCPVCGSSFGDIAENGRVGCADCYREFSRELEGTINRIHGDALHRGRTPKAWKKKNDRETEIKTLKKQLSEAISAEEFERAAELRDKIRSMESDK